MFARQNDYKYTLTLRFCVTLVCVKWKSFEMMALFQPQHNQNYAIHKALNELKLALETDDTSAWFSTWASRCSNLMDSLQVHNGKITSRNIHHVSDSCNGWRGNRKWGYTTVIMRYYQNATTTGRIDDVKNVVRWIMMTFDITNPS